MKEKRGFTLIELLAVIVILAIIALIAVPIVLNMISNARKNAAISSAYGYIESVEMYQEMQDINSLEKLEEGQYNIAINTSINDNTYNPLNSYVKMKGKKATSGKVHITSNGGVDNAVFCMNDYVIIYQNNKAVIDSNDCDEIDMYVSFGTDTEEWAREKTLTITYPNKNYDFYYKIESGKAVLNSTELTNNQNIKADSNVVVLTLKENSVVTAWIEKNGTKKVEQTFEETKIDNTNMTITTATSSSYPTITSSGVSLKTTLRINYTPTEGTSAYYSVDNGENWTKYTSPILLDSTNIKAKLIRDISNIESDVTTVSNSTGSGAPGSQSYDGNPNSGILLINQSLSATYNVDSSAYGRTVYFTWNKSTYYGNVTLRFYDGSGNEIPNSGYTCNQGPSCTNSTTYTASAAIPNNAKTARINFSYSSTERGCYIYEVWV